MIKTVPTGLLLHLKFMEFYGLKEIPGNEHNPVIMGWVRDLHFEATVLDDETAWCSLFINWLCWKLGLERSMRLDARSWLRIGINVPIEEAQLGDIVVFWRENISSWKGHVGLFNGYDDKYIYTGGGNQNNQVNISPYPIESKGYGFMAARRLRTLDELRNVA